MCLNFWTQVMLPSKTRTGFKMCVRLCERATDRDGGAMSVVSWLQPTLAWEMFPVIFEISRACRAGSSSISTEMKVLPFSAADSTLLEDGVKMNPDGLWWSASLSALRTPVAPWMLSEVWGCWGGGAALLQWCHCHMIHHILLSSPFHLVDWLSFSSSLPRLWLCFPPRFALCHISAFQRHLIWHKSSNDNMRSEHEMGTNELLCLKQLHFASNNSLFTKKSHCYHFLW